jgi:hypothetical protein
MRTKTLVLTAVVGAIGIASAAAQTVYSVNAVGYVNKTVKAGQFALLTNPLNLPTNSITAVLPDVPNNNTVVWKYNGASFLQSTKRASGWSDATMTLNPGEGFFVQNKGTADITITFVGEVLTGAQDVALGTGYSLLGSKIPQAGKVQTDLGLPAKNGDIVYTLNAEGKYNSSTRRTDAQGWPAGEPVLSVGDGFWYFNKSGVAGSWSRTFTIPQ